MNTANKWLLAKKEIPWREFDKRQERHDDKRANNTVPSLLSAKKKEKPNRAELVFDQQI